MLTCVFIQNIIEKKTIGNCFDSLKLTQCHFKCQKTVTLEK